jgi:hypothetical protein
MQLLEKRIAYKSKADVFDLIPLGDIHLGNAGCDKEHLKKIVDYIRITPRTLWCGMGDLVEAIQPGIDPRFDPYAIDPEYCIKDLSSLISKQINDIKNLLLPIKDKCLFMLTGNHEDNVRIRYYRDVTLELCVALGVPYGGYDCFFRLIFSHRPKLVLGKSSTVVIYANHGFGGGRRSGGKINKLDDVCNAFDADIILLAHDHKKIVNDSIKLGIQRTDKLKLVQRKQVSCMTGSFLKSYVENAMCYAEKKGYHPNDLGVVKIMMKPWHDDIHCSL